MHSPQVLADSDDMTALIADLRDRFKRWGIDHQINIYPGAGHAFSAPVAPLRNDAADAASWIDALQFLHEHLPTV